MTVLMDGPQNQLFGEFPRAVGSPNQHIVHSPGEFDVFTDTVQGYRNAYASISWFDLDGTVKCDKVSFDLDSAGKEAEFGDDVRDDQKIAMMRDDPDLADDVLGDVCEEAQKLARAGMDDGYPVIGVFSGFGIHIHFLTKPEEDPAENIGSVARRYRDQLTLATLDHKPIGDAQRIMRVPNMRRVHIEDLFTPGAPRWPCDLWTVPLTGDELAAVTPRELLELSKEPRPAVIVEADSRPDMPLYEAYTESSETYATARPDRPTVEGEIDDEGVEFLMKELLQMPCMYENIILDPEPPHEVRLNSAVLLFNLGYGPSEVCQLFSRLGWSDWDREVTRKQLNHIYKKGYSDMSCETIQNMGYCTRQDDPESCKTHGWSGGSVEWR